MHEWGTRMLLRHYLDQGLTKTELSRRFGVSQRTIHYWIESGQLDRDLATGQTSYAPRLAVASKLDPYKGIIEARLQEFPKLSAQRLFDEISAAGYAGGYSRVRDYVRMVRPQEPLDPVVRFETPAARQGQVVFGRFVLSWGARYALVVVLSYSRLLWLRFYRTQTMEVLTDGLESAFERFGGVPEELLFDQMRAVALSDDRGERRRADSEHGVPAVRRALGIPCPIVPTVPSAHEGQGGAADPLHPRELLLRPAVRQRRGSQRAGRAVA